MRSSSPRGTGVRVRIGAIDLLTLDVAASVIARLDAAAADSGDANAAADDDESESAGPLAIAIDVAPEEAGVERRPDRRRACVRLALPTRFSTLQVALGVSVAFHGALLGVRFADPEGFNRMFEDSPLEVVLVNSRSGEAPEKAQAIAQASLAGGGEAAAGRATSPLPPSALTEIGDANEETKQADRAAAGDLREACARRWRRACPAGTSG